LTDRGPHAAARGAEQNRRDCRCQSDPLRQSHPIPPARRQHAGTRDIGQEEKKSKPGISPSGMRSISIVTSTSLIWWADAAICRWTRSGIELRTGAMLDPSLMTAKTWQPVACGVGDLGLPLRLTEPAQASGGPGPFQTAWRGRQNTLSVISLAPVAQR
jgi:hypothetical protein